MIAPVIDPVIEIEQITFRREGKPALAGLSLRVQRGETFGFLGPNGAGKSTTIKILLGLIFPDSGKVLLHGLPPSDVRSRERVGFLPEDTAYYRFLTPTEILHFYGRLFRIPHFERKKRIEKLLDEMGLADVRNRLLSTFSKGMLQKVGLAQALVNEPDTLVLDEPTSGLDPLARMDLHDLLTRLKRQGKTIFFSSHELSEVELLCDSIAIIKSGSLVYSGSLDSVLGQGKEQNLERLFLKTMRGGSR